MFGYFSHSISIDKLLMYIKNKKDPKINPCGIPVQLSAQDKH